MKLADTYKVVKIVTYGPGYETISNHASQEEAIAEIHNVRNHWRQGDEIVVLRISHQAVAKVTASVTLDKKAL